MSRAYRALMVACAAYFVLFLYFYPKTHAIEDEVGFINQALVWSQGSLSAEGAGYETLGGFKEVQGRHVSWRNPLRSLVVVPFLWIGGYPAIFFSGALLHLAVVLVAAMTLRRLGASPLWALGVLGHPTLALYSRTIMADGLGGLCVATALYLLVSQKKPGLWVGIAIGLGAAARYQVAVVLPFVALSLLFAPLQRPKREGLLCMVGGGAVGLAIVAYNIAVLGHPLGHTTQGFFALHVVQENIVHYGVCLLVLWPGMLLALGTRSTWRWTLAAMCLPFLGFLLAYYWHDPSESFVKNVVLGQRLLQPALPVWIVAYALFLRERILPRVPLGRTTRRALVSLGGGALILGLSLLFQRHQRHLDGMVAAREALERRVPPGSLIITNSTLHKLFEVPRPNVASYRWMRYGSHHEITRFHDLVRQEKGKWYVGFLDKPGLPPHRITVGLDRYSAAEIQTSHPNLTLYRCSPPPG